MARIGPGSLYSKKEQAVDKAGHWAPPSRAGTAPRKGVGDYICRVEAHRREAMGAKAGENLAEEAVVRQVNEGDARRLVQAERGVGDSYLYPK